MSVRVSSKVKEEFMHGLIQTTNNFIRNISVVELPLYLAGDRHCNLRGCDWSGVFMPHVLIVFLLLMQTLSIITFSSDWKLQALLNKNTAKEWNVYSLCPHYRAFRNQTIRPNTMALNCLKPTPFSDVWTLCQNAGFPMMIV